MKVMSLACALPLGRPALVPELALHVSDDLVATWEALGGDNPPFWACAWPGGQAVARWLLDHDDHVRGRSVVDMGCGSGMVALAAAAAGAGSVTAVDVDPAAGEALQANIAANRRLLAGASCEITFSCRDLLDDVPLTAAMLCAGDVCYTADMTGRMIRWLRRCAGAGSTVIIGDPDRRFFPVASDVSLIASYDVPTSPGLEGRASASTAVYQLHG